MIALAVIIVSACGNKQNKNSDPRLETYSKDRFEAIVSQMAKVEDVLLYEKDGIRLPKWSLTDSRTLCCTLLSTATIHY